MSTFLDQQLAKFAAYLGYHHGFAVGFDGRGSGIDRQHFAACRWLYLDRRWGSSGGLVFGFAMAPAEPGESKRGESGERRAVGFK